MTNTRKIAQAYINLLAQGKFAEALGSLAPDVNYRIIGKTPSSRTYDRAGLLKYLAPAMAKFQQPPVLVFEDLIVEGNRAVALASGKGIGPTGLLYDQPYYAMVMDVENGAIRKVIEFLDTAEIETQIFGRKFQDS